MPSYTRGEMILTIKVEDTFVVDVEQGQEVRSFVTGVPTQDSILVTMIGLQQNYSDYFLWKDSMLLICELRKRS